MNPAFIILVIIICIAVWFLASALYKPIGRFVGKVGEDAEVARTNAQAKADAKMIEAEAEANANKLLEQSLTDKILRQRYIEKWNGELPKVSGDNSMILDMNDFETTENTDK